MALWRVALFLGFALGACPRPGPTPTPRPWAVDARTVNPGVPDCGQVTVLTSDVCPSFTSSGAACANCLGAAECWDRPDAIYCASAIGCDVDPRCSTPTGP